MISPRTYFNRNVKGKQPDEILKIKRDIQKKIDAFEIGKVSIEGWETVNPVEEYCYNIELLNLVNAYFAEQYKKNIGKDKAGYILFIRRVTGYSSMLGPEMDAIYLLKREGWTIGELAERFKRTSTEIELFLDLSE